MDNVNAKEAVRELTMMLIYLTRLTNEKDFQTAKDFFAWKSYDWDTIDDLVESGMICQGKKSADAAGTVSFQKLSETVALWRDADHEPVELSFHADALPSGRRAGSRQYGSGQAQRIFAAHQRCDPSHPVPVLRTEVCGCRDRRACGEHLPSAGTF